MSKPLYRTLIIVILVFTLGWKTEDTRAKLDAIGGVDGELSAASDKDPFANTVVDYAVFGNNNTHTDPSLVLGSPCKGTNQDLSLGGGWVIVDMGEGEEIDDTEGNDLRVYESEENPYCNGGAASPYEVFVSNSPVGPWISIGEGSGVYGFDLATSGLDSARYVKVEDRSSGQPDNSSKTPGADIAGFKDLNFCKTNEWQAAFFTNKNLTGEAVETRCDNKIDFVWWDKATPYPTLEEGNFSVRWDGKINFPKSGLYRFRTLSEGGMRVYLDGTFLGNLGDWNDHVFREKSTTKEITQGNHIITVEFYAYHEDALAYFNWYLCPGGLNDCSMNISPDYQTRYLDAPMPETCTDESNQTIARWGCLITSISMALGKYGVNTTPEELNHWLSGEDPDTSESPRGYKSTCNGSLVWDEILKFVKEKGKDLKWQAATDAASVIREQKLPVIMQVAGGGHYVLATDVLEQGNITSFGINDPHHAWACLAVAASPSLPPKSILQCDIGEMKHATTVQEENVHKGTTIPLKYLKEQSEPRTSSLQLFADGVEIIITDAQGRRVGYDQITGNVLTEIPNSFYYDASIVPPGESHPGIVERVLYLPEFAEGTYSLLVTSVSSSTLSLAGLSSVPFNVEAIGFDSEFIRVTAATSGSLANGQTAEYQITYDPGQDVHITDASDNKMFLPLVDR